MANNSSERPILPRTRSISSSPSNSEGSTHTIDSAQKITLIEPVIQQDTWRADTETDLLNIDEFKIKRAQAKHWKELKQDLRNHVAKMKGDAISKKFEIEIKVIGRKCHS